MTEIYHWILARLQDLRQEQGAAAVEYGLLVGLIAVAIIGAVFILGTELNEMFTAIGDALEGVIVGTPPAA